MRHSFAFAGLLLICSGVLSVPVQISSEEIGIRTSAKNNLRPRAKDQLGPQITQEEQNSHVRGRGTAQSSSLKISTTRFTPRTSKYTKPLSGIPSDLEGPNYPLPKTPPQLLSQAVIILEEELRKAQSREEIDQVWYVDELDDDTVERQAAMYFKTPVKAQTKRLVLKMMGSPDIVFASQPGRLGETMRSYWKNLPQAVVADIFIKYTDLTKGQIAVLEKQFPSLDFAYSANLRNTWSSIDALQKQRIGTLIVEGVMTAKQLNRYESMVVTHVNPERKFTDKDYAKFLKLGHELQLNILKMFTFKLRDT